PFAVGTQPTQFADQQVDHVVGVALRVNARQIPAPASAGVIERHQSFVDQRRQELNHEERIAGRLLVHQLRQGRRAAGVAVQRVLNQPAYVVSPEGGESNLLHEGAVGAANRLQSAHEGMGGRDLVVPVRADEKEVSHIALDHQVLEQIKRGEIETLQIVQKQGERMFGPSEDPQKPSEHELEAALRVLWRQFRDLWLVADNDLQVGGEIHHELSVRAERLMARVPPEPQFVVALGQERTDQTLKSLREGGVRNVA